MKITSNINLLSFFVRDYLKKLYKSKLKECVF